MLNLLFACNLLSSPLVNCATLKRGAEDMAPCWHVRLGAGMWNSMSDMQIYVHLQSYTQFGGLRPFGVSFLFAGWDKHYGFQLYHTDPSGNYSGWKATAIGVNNQSAQTILKQVSQGRLLPRHPLCRVGVSSLKI